MNKNILTSIIINIIFLVLIVLFVNYKLENFGQPPILNTETGERTQNSGLNNNASAQKDEGQKYAPVSGTIKEINNNQLIIKLATSPHATTEKIDSGDFSFIINDNSKILKAEIKDQKTFEEESKLYENRLKEINDQIAKNPNQAVEKIVPPQPYVTKAGSAADLKINSKISVVFNQTVADKPLAAEITIMP
ncbi:MAG: hypothetical protein ABIB72_02550 [Candidatus Falkowbacteria bacterium]